MAPTPQASPVPASEEMVPSVGEHTSALVVDSVVGEGAVLPLEQAMRPMMNK